jgi:hypothetical protein
MFIVLIFTKIENTIEINNFFVFNKRLNIAGIETTLYETQK